MKNFGFKWFFILVGGLIILSLIVSIMPESELKRLVEPYPDRASVEIDEHKDPNMMRFNDVLTGDGVSCDVRIIYFGEMLSENDFTTVEKHFRNVMYENIKIKNDPSLLTDIYNVLDLFFVPEVNDCKFISISTISIKPNSVIRFSESCEIKDKIFEFYFLKDRQVDFEVRVGNEI